MKTNQLFMGTPSPEEIARQEQLVKKLKDQLNRKMDSPEVEIYRSRWGKARAILSQMQGAYHFSNQPAYV